MTRRVFFLLFLLLTFMGGISRAQTPAEPEPAPVQDWLGLSAHQGAGIDPGTRITMANWQQYQQIHAAWNDRTVRGQVFLE